MKFWDAFGHHVRNAAPNDELTGFRLVGGQVLEVMDQLKSVAVPTAHAYIRIARGLELFADTLVEPYLGQEGAPALPAWVQNQALHLYRPIPPLVTAARQEAIDPDGPRDVDFPWILMGRVWGAERETGAVLRGYVDAMKAVMDDVEVLLSEVGNPKKARLYFAEATTNFDSARYLLQDHQDMSLANKASLDDYLWTALGYALGAVQEGCVPGIMQDLDIDTLLESREHPHGSTPVAHQSSDAGTPLLFLDTVRQIADAWNQAGSYDHHEHHHHDEHHHHEHHHRDWD